MSKQSGSSSTSMNKRRRARSARKTRTRKPKFLSLRLQLSGDNKTDTTRQESGFVPEPESATTSDGRPQLNLFPLHPENLLEEKDACHEENDVVAYNFFSAAEESGATTLTGLLGAPSTSASSGEDNHNHNNTNKKAFSSSDSLRYPFGGCRGAALVRTALRNKERNPSEEKWVCYSEVVEKERKDEEVTSCASDLRQRVDNLRRLSLKLDYEEIINAWSDKGSLYIKAESPQTVPDIINDDFLSSYYETSSHGAWGGGWENNMSLYTVPEMAGSSSSNKCMNNGEPPEGGGGGDEDAKQTAAAAGQNHRAASVLRYKEKRQNRLFSKTIRYEVRKLNAEKRPRVKGRFVKRD